MSDHSFKDFALDQLGDLENLRAKPMFGGHGLYQANRFFGILMDGRLFLKTDAQSRAEYLERGMEPFTYEKGRRIVSLNYHEVPSDVLENRDQLLLWARRAVQSALLRAKKPPRQRATARVRRWKSRKP